MMMMMMRLMMMKMKRGMLARQMKMMKRYVIVLVVLVPCFFGSQFDPVSGCTGQNLAVVIWVTNYYQSGRS
jgi:hypothetical protein